MAALFSQSKFGRRRRQVNYCEVDNTQQSQSKSKSSSNKRFEITFTSFVYNTLGDAVRKGFKLQNISQGTKYLIAAKKIIKTGSQWQIMGKYVSTIDGKQQQVEDTMSIDTQPDVLIIEILTNTKDIDEENDIANELYKNITRKYNLPENYLSFTVGQRVLHRPSPQRYRKGEPISYAPVLATITKVTPHSSVGDLSPEYEIKIDQVNGSGDNNAIIFGGAVHSAYLRDVAWQDSERDKFDTSPFGVMEFEAERAMVSLFFFVVFVFFLVSRLALFGVIEQHYKLYGYLVNSGLNIVFLPYMDINSAFFNHKRDYLEIYSQLQTNKNYILKLSGIKIKNIFEIVLQDCKPQEHNAIKEKSIKTHNTLRKYGKTMECCEIQVLMDELIGGVPASNENQSTSNNSNSNDEKDNTNDSNKIVHVSYSHVWFVFSDLSQMTTISDIKGQDLTTKLKLGTEISLKCSNDHPLQFEWSRNSKLMSLNSFSFHTRKQAL